MQLTTQQLTTQFGKPNTISFSQTEHNIQLLHINNSHATATISLYGAHVLSFTPHQQAAVLWMSEAAIFKPGKAIRGGIPLCFPWFGPHATDATKAQHGFARVMPWQVLSIESLSNDNTKVILQLQSNNETLTIWPYQFNAQLIVEIGVSLKVQLQVTNNDIQTFTYSNALHSYFNISNIEQINILGLQNAAYYWGFENEVQQQLEEKLCFVQEENRRYINHTQTCTIIDETYNRKMVVEKQGSKVTVVWNPGQEVATSMADIHPNGYQNFVCIEPANAYNGIDEITLQPGQSHTLGTTISVESL
jgi:glucose-6-phosphate 1-epimerase